MNVKSEIGQTENMTCLLVFPKNISKFRLIWLKRTPVIERQVQFWQISLLPFPSLSLCEVQSWKNIWFPSNNLRMSQSDQMQRDITMERYKWIWSKSNLTCLYWSLTTNRNFLSFDQILLKLLNETKTGWMERWTR